MRGAGLSLPVFRVGRFSPCVALRLQTSEPATSEIAEDECCGGIEVGGDGDGQTAWTDKEQAGQLRRGSGRPGLEEVSKGLGGARLDWDSVMTVMSVAD